MIASRRAAGIGPPLNLSVLSNHLSSLALGVSTPSENGREEVQELSRPLPFDCPRGLNRVEAARYIGVSPGTFDRLVEEGLMPTPKKVRARLIFDRHAIDVAFSALGEEPGPDSDGGESDWD